MNGAGLGLFLLGSAVMTLELLWARGLALALGSDLEGYALGLGLFLLGSAAGSALSGRLRAAPRRWIAAGFAAAVLVEGWVSHVVPAVTNGWSALGTVAGKLVAAAPVAVPACFLAGALPAWFWRTLDRDAVAARTGRWVALLDWGSALGSLLTPLLFLPLVGATGTSAIAFVLLAGAFSVAPRSSGLAARRGPTGARSSAVVRGSVIFAAGAFAFALQMTWARLLGEILGTSLLVLGVAAAASLLGGGLGSRALPWALGRGTRNGVTLLAWAGWACAQGGCFALLQYLPTSYLSLLTWGDPSGSWPVMVKLGLVIAVVVPPSICAGFLFPCLVAGWSRDEADLVHEAGTLQAWAFLGGTGGATATGFLLVPTLGTNHTLVLIGVVTAIGGLGALGFRAIRTPGWGVGAGLSVAALLIFLPGWSWESPLLGAGVFQWSRQDIAAGTALPAWQEREIVYSGEGRLARVTIERAPALNTTFLRIGGRVEGSVPIRPEEPSLADLPTAVLLGALPTLFTPADGPVAVIGLGAGTTVATTVTLASGPVTVFEVEPEVEAALRSPAGRAAMPWETSILFDPDGAGPRLILEDARAFLHRDPSRWQAVVCQPSEPWLPWSAPLFTSSFYRLLRSRLEPGGVAIQWVQLYRIGPREFAGILAVFREVFDQVWVFHPHPESGEVILVGGDASVRPRPDDLWGGGAARRAELPYDRLDPRPLLEREGVDRWLRRYPGAGVGIRRRLEFRLPLVGDRGEDRSGEILRSLRSAAR